MDMTPREYQQYVQRKMKKSPLGKDVCLAFFVGGAICVLGQVILDGWMSLGLPGGGKIAYLNRTPLTWGMSWRICASDSPFLKTEG